MNKIILAVKKTYMLFGRFLPILVGLWSASYSPALSSSIVFKANDNYADLFLTGPIEHGDFNNLEQEFLEYNNRNIVVRRVYLDSLGGNVDEALKIGRFFHQMRTVTIAPLGDLENEICASACALIWAGGIYRIGEVYVHRPSLDDEKNDISLSEWEASLEHARTSISEYLNEVGIPQIFSERFFAIRSSEIELFVASENHAVFDPIFEEFILSRCGTGLDQNETVTLRFLEEKSDFSLNSDPVYVITLKLLKEKQENFQNCGQDALFNAQAEVQLRL